MSDKSKTKKKQNKNEKNPKNKTKPSKECTKEQKIPQTERQAQKVNLKPSVENVDNAALQTNISNTIPDTKREAGDVLKITEKPNAKFSRREIKSNWPEFELPPEDYETYEETSRGADFETLLNTPMSLGGHFQFKHEKTWTERKKSTEYTDLFGLDSKFISNAISCIPFYERNRLSPTLFSSEETGKMKNIANKNMTISGNLIANFIQKPEMNTDNIVSNEINSVKKDILPAMLEKVVLNDECDDELDMLLESALQPLNSDVKLPVVSSKGVKGISIPNVSSQIKPSVEPPKVNEIAEVDLDKWLDDYLES